MRLWYAAKCLGVPRYSPRGLGWRGIAAEPVAGQQAREKGLLPGEEDVYVSWRKLFRVEIVAELGRVLALLGIAPTKITISNLGSR